MYGYGCDIEKWENLIWFAEHVPKSSSTLVRLTLKLNIEKEFIV